MKKVTLLLIIGFASSANLLFSQEPMRDQPDGTCMTCDTCDDTYIVCESDEVDAYFDKMNNCAPGSDTTILILEGC